MPCFFYLHFLIEIIIILLIIDRGDIKRKRWHFAVSIFLIGVGALHAQGIAIGPHLGIHKSKDADGSKLMGGVAFRLTIGLFFGL